MYGTISNPQPVFELPRGRHADEIHKRNMEKLEEWKATELKIIRDNFNEQQQLLRGQVRKYGDAVADSPKKEAS